MSILTIRGLLTKLERLRPSRWNRTRAPLYLFITILILAFAQISWWLILLVGDTDPNHPPPDPQARTRRIIMIASEGMAFAVVMACGAYLIYRSLRREEQLRRDEANFLSAVTHELKSPLASLRLHAESLELRASDAGRVKTYAARMTTDVDRLERLVENLLAAGRADAGALDMRPVEVNLSEELQQYAAGFAPMLSSRGFELILQIEPDVKVGIDPGALQTVIENLLDNAIKYSEPPSAITLRLYRAGSNVIMEVSDQGVGLTAAESKRVFERFYRAGDERIRTTKGTGLGLYLVREIVKAHWGDVTVQSDGPGKGATFRVSLPALA
ncbi:MAG: sensor histidine kinase [Planctomycetota bacterium]